MAPFAVILNVTMLCIGFAVALAVRLSRSQSVTLGIETAVQNAALALVIASSVLKVDAMGGGRGPGGMTAGVVHVLRDDEPVAVPVRVGATDGSFTQIVGPLKAGDEVIIGGGPKAKAKATQGGPMGGGGGVRVRM